MKKKIIVLFSVITLLLACSVLASCAIDTKSAATLVLTVETALDADEVGVAASSGKIVKNGKNFTINFSNRNNHTITVWAKDYLTETLVVSAVDFKAADSISRTVKLENKKLNAIKLSVTANSVYNIEKINQFDGEITKKGSAVTITVPKLSDVGEYKFKISGNDLEPLEIAVSSSDIVGGYYARSVMLTEKDTRLIYINNMGVPNYILTEELRVLRPIIDNVKHNPNSGNYNVRDFYIKLAKNDKVIIEERDANFVVKLSGADVQPYGTEVNVGGGKESSQLTKKLFVDLASYDEYNFRVKVGNNKKYINVDYDHWYGDKGEDQKIFFNIGNDGKLFIDGVIDYMEDGLGTQMVLEYTFTDKQLADSFENPIKVKKYSGQEYKRILDADYTKKEYIEKIVYYDISQKAGDSYAEISREDINDMVRISDEQYYDGNVYCICYYYSPKVTYKFKFDADIYDTSKFSFKVNNYTFNYSAVADSNGNITIDTGAYSASGAYKVVIRYSFSGNNEMEESKFFFDGEYTVSQDGKIITFTDVMRFGGYGIVSIGTMQGYGYRDIVPLEFNAIGNINHSGTNEITFVSENDNDIIMLSYRDALIRLTAKFKVRVGVYVSGSEGNGNFVAETIEPLTLEKYIEIGNRQSNNEGNEGNQDKEDFYKNSPVPMKVISQNIQLYNNKY